MTVGQSGSGASDIFAQVREGMEVYDATGKKVGTVKRVFLGGTAPAGQPGQVTDEAARQGGYDETFWGDIFESFRPSGGLSDEMRLDLERRGFMEVDGEGLFAADRYATPDKIASIGDGRVTLATSGDNLPKV